MKKYNTVCCSGKLRYLWCYDFRFIILSGICISWSNLRIKVNGLLSIWCVRLLYFKIFYWRLKPVVYIIEFLHSGRWFPVLSINRSNGSKREWLWICWWCWIFGQECQEWLWILIRIVGEHPLQRPKQTGPNAYIKKMDSQMNRSCEETTNLWYSIFWMAQ